MDDYVNYEARFRDLIDAHKGDPDYELIKDYPEVFSLLTKISSDRGADGMTKAILNCALSYFVLPTDIISEKEQGIQGYIDDFYICLEALRLICEHDEVNSKYLIKKYWFREGNPQTFISEKYYSVVTKLSHSITRQIKSFSGLNYLSDLIHAKKGRSYADGKRKMLKRQITYLLFMIFGEDSKIVDSEEKRMYVLNKISSSDEFNEFVRDIELLSRKDRKYVPAAKNVEELLSVDEMLRKIKAERIVDGRS